MCLHLNFAYNCAHFSTENKKKQQTISGCISSMSISSLFYEEKTVPNLLKKITTNFCCRRHFVTLLHVYCDGQVLCRIFVAWIWKEKNNQSTHSWELAKIKCALFQSPNHPNSWRREADKAKATDGIPKLCVCLHS